MEPLVEIEKLNNTSVSLLVKAIKQMDNKDIIKDNLDKVTFDMNWMVLKVLLEIEGIDKIKLLKLWFKSLENVFEQTEWIKVIEVLEDGSSTIEVRKINNADEIINIANLFLNSNEISEEDKIILRKIILRNFQNIIQNSHYSMKTIEKMQDMGISSKDIFDNKEEILHNISGRSVPDFYNYCRDNDESISISAEEFAELLFNDNKKIFPEEIDNLSSRKKKDYEITMYAIKKIISELAERQNLDLNDIKYLASGFYSETFKVGEFVVKIGQVKVNKGVPYSKYIIRPLISYQVKRGVNIEVQNFVDVKWYEGLTEEKIEEELFCLYVKLRKEGITWKDIKKENVGRLLKRNSSNFEIEYEKEDGEKGTYEMDVPDEMLDVVGRNEGENEILSAGELVVIDRDYFDGRGASVPRNPTAEICEKFDKEYRNPNKFREALKTLLGEKEFDKKYGERSKKSFNK